MVDYFEWPPRLPLRLTLHVDFEDYVQRSHSQRTMEVIERVFEFAEEQREPFTVTQCWKSTYGHYQCVSQTLLSMQRNGLLVDVASPGGRPKQLLSIDVASADSRYRLIEE